MAIGLDLSSMVNENADSCGGTPVPEQREVLRTSSLVLFGGAAYVGWMAIRAAGLPRRPGRNWEMVALGVGAVIVATVCAIAWFNGNAVTTC